MQLNFNSFNEIVVLLLLASAIGAAAVKLRQPLIISFIGVGILLGPSALGIIKSQEQVHLLSEIGLSLLLFVVGLRLDIGQIRSLGFASLLIGVGQVSVTAVFVFLIAISLGIQPVTAFYISIALTFSSTVIIVKLLSDKKETDSLHGRIAVGVLIIQDILVILAMIGVTAYAGSNDNHIGLQALLILGRGMALLGSIGVLMYLVLPHVVAYFAKSSELLILFAIAWALAVASAADMLGLGKEAGAFMAGVSLASTAYREAMGSRLVSLRDFLLLFFFVDLGMRLDIKMLGGQVWTAIPFSFSVLLGKPIIIMVLMGIMGYRKRTSFLTGLTMAQISEFSLIFVALGLKVRHVSEETVGLITLIGLITIGLSSYFIIFSQKIYEFMSPYIGVLERKIPHREQESDASASAAKRADVILFGLGTYCTGVGEHLMSRGHSILGIDFDPQIVKDWNRRGMTAWYGDAEDPEFPSMLPLSRARWVVCAVSDYHVNLTLMKALKENNYRGNVAVTARDCEESFKLQQEGADLVLEPYSDAATQAVDKWEAADIALRRKKMDQKISEMKSHYIVCGYGRMGQQIIRDFKHRGIPHVVIETNPEQLPKLIEGGIPFVEGNPSEDRTLLAARIDHAKGLIAVNPTDEDNVFITLSARGLNPKLHIIARSILLENEDKLKRAGANQVISPYILGGRIMSAAALEPGGVEFIEHVVTSDNSEVEICDAHVAQSAPFTGKRLKESGIRENTGALVLAVKHGDGSRTLNPGPDEVIHAGDELIIMGTEKQTAAVLKLASGRG